MTHRTTGVTPYEAKKARSHLGVKQKSQLHAKRNRSHPELNVGDKAKVYTKKGRFEKERVSVGSDGVYKFEQVNESKYIR